MEQLDALLGETIGKGNRYRLDALLGVGALSRTYKAFDQNSCFDAQPIYRAVKFLGVDFTDQEEAWEQFQRELQAWQCIQDNRIVSVVDGGTVTLPSQSERSLEFPFIVTELIDAPTLADLLLRGAMFTPDQVVAIASQIAQALQVIHTGVRLRSQSGKMIGQVRFMHQALKPTNIFVLNDSPAQSVVKLADFGIAKLIDNLAEMGTPLLKKLEQGIFNRHYGAPEQFQDQSNTDPRADIYSLGCILYELLSGENPYRLNVDRDLKDWQEQIMNTLPLDLSPALEVPEPLQKIVFRCLEKNPAMRFATAKELDEALRNLEIEFSLLQISSTNSTPTEVAPSKVATSRPIAKLQISRSSQQKSKSTDLRFFEKIGDLRQFPRLIAFSLLGAIALWGVAYSISTTTTAIAPSPTAGSDGNLNINLHPNQAAEQAPTSAPILNQSQSKSTTQALKPAIKVIPFAQASPTIKSDDPKRSLPLNPLNPKKTPQPSFIPISERPFPPVSKRANPIRVFPRTNLSQPVTPILSPTAEIVDTTRLTTIAPGNLKLVLDANNSKSFFDLVQQAEAQARQAIGQEFGKNPHLKEVSIMVLGDRQGQLVPILSAIVPRSQWLTGGSIQSLINYVNTSDVLLGFASPQVPKTSTQSYISSNSNPTNTSIAPTINVNPNSISSPTSTSSQPESLLRKESAPGFRDD